MKMIMMSSLCVIVQQIDNNVFVIFSVNKSYYVAWSRIFQTCGALNNTLLCRS